jgi:low affinity Fe/Cu permease
MSAVQPSRRFNLLLEQFTYKVTEWAGSARAFVLALVIVVAWAATGPLFHYSDTWQLVINTGTTVITFLMVFMLQRSQNKESMAVQVKLNELIAAMKGASNRMINIEALSEADVRGLHARYQRLAEMVAPDPRCRSSHSIEETRAEPTPAADDPADRVAAALYNTPSPEGRKRT